MKNYISVLIVFSLFLLFSNTNLDAAYLQNVPQTITQPDGTTLECFATGDEFYN
jgi:hypothetical protein